ncbi:unnamed protein product [Ceratitis capitata]|uniref:(Mediterranean fruit fly) hypothetical protein n=1 Tax=Ceratitis capitata TaxID=7213 RepID=A0A811UIP9_CERCA|nr:unnamed protein product [Ceratitis capitata]
MTAQKGEVNGLTDTQLRQKWKENLGLDPAVELPQFNCYMCLEHFENSAIGVGGRLRSVAVPTLKIVFKQLKETVPRSGVQAKCKRLRTGGGSFSGEELSEFEEQALSAFGMGAVNGLECVTLGLPGTFTTPATPSPLSEEKAYLIE